MAQRHRGYSRGAWSLAARRFLNSPLERAGFESSLRVAKKSSTISTELACLLSTVGRVGENRIPTKAEQFRRFQNMPCQTLLLALTCATFCAETASASEAWKKSRVPGFQASTRTKADGALNSRTAMDYANELRSVVTACATVTSGGLLKF